MIDCMPMVQPHKSAEQIVNSRLRAMSPSEKIRVSLQLYWSAREFKSAWLRSRSPKLTESEIQKMVKEAFMYART